MKYCIKAYSHYENIFLTRESRVAGNLFTVVLVYLVGKLFYFCYCFFDALSRNVWQAYSVAVEKKTLQSEAVSTSVLIWWMA